MLDGNHRDSIGCCFCIYVRDVVLRIQSLVIYNAGKTDGVPSIAKDGIQDCLKIEPA